jgi:CelD/BcsL family acetyltransferase involved in cellulose biosynthesis
MMDGESRMPVLLKDAFAALGFVTEITPMGEAPHIALPLSWDAYLGNLKKKHRYSVVRVLREFSHWAGADVAMEVAVSDDDLRKGKAILQSLHEERWQKSGVGGRFRSSRFASFHDAVMPLLLREGALELLWLNVRGQPVAAQYNIVWNRKVYFYQCGRKVDLPEQVRPGQVLLLLAIRRAIESGHREFDFLNGAAPYKMQLATGVRPLVGLRVVRRCVAECLYQWMERRVNQLRELRHRWQDFWRANQ